MKKSMLALVALVALAVLTAFISSHFRTRQKDLFASAPVCGPQQELPPDFVKLKKKICKDPDFRVLTDMITRTFVSEGLREAQQDAAFGDVTHSICTAIEDAEDSGFNLEDDFGVTKAELRAWQVQGYRSEARMFLDRAEISKALAPQIHDKEVRLDMELEAEAELGNAEDYARLGGTTLERIKSLSNRMFPPSPPPPPDLLPRMDWSRMLRESTIS